MFNLHRKLLGESPMVYCDPASAIIVSSLIGVGSSLYQAGEQEEAAEKERKRLEAAAEEQRLETERIAKETRPEGETIEGIEFGTGSKAGDIGSTSDFLVPKTSALGASSTGLSGLGFKV